MVTVAMVTNSVARKRIPNNELCCGTRRNEANATQMKYTPRAPFRPRPKRCPSCERLVAVDVLARFVGHGTQGRCEGSYRTVSYDWTAPVRARPLQPKAAKLLCKPGQVNSVHVALGLDRAR
jgi:hypothetical protein